MSQFIQNLLKRNTKDNTAVRPRLFSRFESFPGSINNLDTAETIEQRDADESKNIQVNEGSNIKSEEEINADDSKTSLTFKNLEYSEAQENKEFHKGILNEDSINSEPYGYNFLDGKKIEPSLSTENSNGHAQSGFGKENTKLSDIDDIKVFNKVEKISLIDGDSPALLESSVPLISSSIPSDSSSETPSHSRPLVKITIGSIEVKANMEKQKATPLKRAVKKPKMSLQDYLDKQKKAQ